MPVTVSPAAQDTGLSFLSDSILVTQEVKPELPTKTELPLLMLFHAPDWQDG